jgi:hypothetical protein
VKRATELFLKALGAIYLIAFVSFGVQADGLIGSQGILPVANYLQGMREALGAGAYWYAPTVFWANSSDLALRVAWIAGALLAIVLMLGFFRRVCLIALLILYISISTAGQDFWSFQWDILLTEAGFLAIFADGSPRAHVAVSMAAVPADVHVRPGEALERRSHVARPDSDDLPL